VASCNRNDQLVSEYGKVIGEKGGISVNGTSVLYGMFRERGFRTKRFRKISPRLNRYDTVIWFPDNYQCPSPEALDALQTWLDDGSGRTLIYVGRDFDAEIGYYQQLLEVADESDRENLVRNLAEAKTNQDSRIRRYVGDDTSASCDWFNIERVPYRRIENVVGELASDVDKKSASLSFSTILKPSDEVVTNQNLAVAPLLTADGVDFVYSVSVEDEDHFRNQLIVVNNGSFLLNYGLVNKQNRLLAGALIDQCQSADVVFLESGPAGIEISDQDIVNHNSWAWIAKPPLRYIAPHFLLWGVLFCFVFFPIFGRPRKLRTENYASFRSHISAMGKLLQKSKKPEQALEKVRDYQATHAKDTNFP
jgi:hypothetical protein